MLRRFNNILQTIDNIVKAFCLVVLSIMVIDIGFQIFCRYALKFSFAWTEELARYLMVWLAYFGASTMVRRWENVSVTFFLERMNQHIATAIIYCIKIMVLAFLIIVAYLSIKVLPQGLYQNSPGLNISMFWPQLGMVIGIFLMIIQLFGNIMISLFDERLLMENDTDREVNTIE